MSIARRGGRRKHVHVSASLKCVIIHVVLLLRGESATRECSLESRISRVPSEERDGKSERERESERREAKKKKEA